MHIYMHNMQYMYVAVVIKLRTETSRLLSHPKQTKY